MSKHLFLTGPKHIGKSTILRKILANRPLRQGGFLTLRIRTPDGGDVHMLRAGREESCTSENLLFVKRYGIPGILSSRFDQLGCAILSERFGCDLLLMDELGPGESEALEFQQAVLACLNGEIPVYGVLQQGSSEFLEQVKAHPKVHLITVTEENRDILPQQLREAGW